MRRWPRFVAEKYAEEGFDAAVRTQRAMMQDALRFIADGHPDSKLIAEIALTPISTMASIEAAAFDLGIDLSPGK